MRKQGCLDVYWQVWGRIQYCLICEGASVFCFSRNSPESWARWAISQWHGIPWPTPCCHDQACHLLWDTLGLCPGLFSRTPIRCRSHLSSSQNHSSPLSHLAPRDVLREHDSSLASQCGSPKASCSWFGVAWFTSSKYFPRGFKSCDKVYRTENLPF